MSMENSPRPEDLQTALELVKENGLLQNDPYINRVLNRAVEDGEVKADNGEPIEDVGNLVATRLAWLEKEAAEVRLAAAERRDKKSYDVAVIGSERPDMEIRD